MPKSTPTEWLLARLTDPDRAAAILGDLTEMSATRGRRWFWTAFVRTLVTIGWRTPVAFICAYKCASSALPIKAQFATMHALFHWFRLDAVPVHHIPLVMRPVHHLPLVIYLQPLYTPLFGLAFLLPFLLVRFGTPDRLTQLASALFLVSTLEYSNQMVGSAMIEALTVITVLVALCMRQWRRPLVVLVLCLIPRDAYVWVIQYSILHGHRMEFGAYSFSAYLAYSAYFACQCIIPAALCLWLHRRLLFAASVSLERPEENLLTNAGGGGL